MKDGDQDSKSLLASRVKSSDDYDAGIALGNMSDVKTHFEYSHQGLTSFEAATLLTKYGRNELPEKTIPKW